MCSSSSMHGTGQRPQNFIRDEGPDEKRYEAYPEQKELLARKTELINSQRTPAMSLKADIRTLPLSSATFGTRFDVILIDPPWHDYARRAPGHQVESWDWEQVMMLNVADLADTPSFVFIWCGNEQHLESGRQCLRWWGFKRVEDIVWLKTNKDSRRRRPNLEAGIPPQQGADQVLTGTKEHCLVGVRGQLRRDMGEFVHAHCDVDVIISEEPPLPSTAKPEELYGIIERFCQGKRRIELFGEDHNVRDGWVTVGNNLSQGKPFDSNIYSNYFRNADGTRYVENLNLNQRVNPGAPILLPFDPHIEEIRPKSPPGPPGQTQSHRGWND